MSDTTEPGNGSQEPEEINLESLAVAGYEAWLRDRPNLIAVDTETEGFEFFDRPFCVTAAWEGVSAYFELPIGTERVREILAGTPTWIFHNAKFDLQKLRLAGLLDDVAPTRFEDTQILSYLTDEHRRHGLKPLAAMLLGEETDEEAALRVVRRKLKLRKDDGYHVLPREVLIPYALKDAEFTYRLYPILLQQLLDAQEDNLELLTLYEMEKELTLVLLDMEAAGVAVDLDYAEATTKEYGTKAMVAELYIRDLTNNEEFNPQSNPQIREAFAARGVERDKFDKNVLKELDDPLAEAILNLRSTKKLHGTYLLPILKEQRDGVLHPNFRQTATRTGRLASGGMEAT